MCNDEMVAGIKVSIIDKGLDPSSNHVVITIGLCLTCHVMTKLIHMKEVRESKNFSYFCWIVCV